MTTRKLALAIGLAAFLLGGIAHAGVPGDLLCKEKKAKATGKKAFDLLKAFGKNEKKPNPTKLDQDVSKARSKFTKGFTKAESKNACLTNDDSDAVEEIVDEFVADTLCSIVGGCALARKITDEADCVGGPLSRCRIDDYLLENDNIRVVIQDVQRNMFGIGQFGGQIIDADLNRGPGEDEIDNFEEWALQINVENTAHYTDIVIVNDGLDGSPAVIRATGPDDLLDYLNPSTVVSSFGFPLPASLDDKDMPIEIMTDYILEVGKNYVRVETTIQNLDGSNQVKFFFGEYFNGSGQVELFQPGYGFGEAQITNGCPVVAANPCNLIAYRGVAEAAGVSYGYVHGAAKSSSFSASGVTVPFHEVEVGFVLIGFQAPNFTLEPQGQPGDQMTFTRYFVVGDGTVSSILEARNEIQGLTPGTGTVTGTVETSSGPLAGAEVAILGDITQGPVSLFPPPYADLNVVNHTVTNAAGEFSMQAAPGTYDLVVNREGYPYQGGGSTPALNPVTVTAGGSADLGTITLPDNGNLQVTVTDGGANPLPAKASFVGFDPSPPYRNNQTALGLVSNTTAVFSDRGADGRPFGVAQVHFIDPNGVADVSIEPGSYEVVVSRGPEYSIDSASITVAAGSNPPVNVQIAPIIETDGFVSADFHVHSIDSPDSEVTKVERVVSMMAEGLEFFTPSEHDIRVDFQDVVTGNGWQSLVTTAISSEITTFDYGHFNAWPMTVDPGQVNGGAVDHGGAAPAGQDFPANGYYNLTPEQIIAIAHSDPGTNTVQINHFYSHLGFEEGGTDLGSGLAIDTGLEPPKSIMPPAVRRLDPAEEDPQKGYFTDTFDALEMWIGGGRGDLSNFLGKNAGDWFNLLNQGIVRTGVADSDTHRRMLTQAGLPRTMVASSVTDLTLLDPDVHSATVNAGKAIGTNAPMVRVSVEALTTSDIASLELGDPVLVSAADGKVEVTVDIQSPVWAEFDTVEYYLNSTTIKTVLEDKETGEHVCSTSGDPCVDNSDCPPSETCTTTKIDVPRYGIAPDFIDAPSVSTVLVDASVPGGSRLEATSILTLDGTTNPALTEDTWIIVMVKGTDGVSRPLFPVIPNSLDTTANVDLADLTDGNLGEDGMLAVAFTNPLFVDVNDDGDYDPPGVSFIVSSPSGAFLDAVGGLLD